MAARRAHPRSPRSIALARPTVPEPLRRQTLALALLADVEPRIAQRALREGAGAIGGDAGHRIAIAMSAMRGEDAAEAARLARAEAERYYASDPGRGPAATRPTAEDIAALGQMSAEEIRIIRRMGIAPSAYVAKRDEVKP